MLLLTRLVPGEADTGSQKYSLWGEERVDLKCKNSTYNKTLIEMKCCIHIPATVAIKVGKIGNIQTKMAEYQVFATVSMIRFCSL